MADPTQPAARDVWPDGSGLVVERLGDETLALMRQRVGCPNHRHKEESCLYGRKEAHAKFLGGRTSQSHVRTCYSVT